MVRDRGLEGAHGRMAETAGTVAFAGWKTQTECAQAIRDEDALVLLSLMECGGAVVLEPMAAGLPVIATAWGGPLDDTCGVLVPPMSREDLIAGFSAALVDLLLHPGRCEAMGQAGRRKFTLQFDWDAKVDALTDVYRSVMTRR
jgi:glycosyltransferase involved in cell wall biosynthesis